MQPLSFESITVDEIHHPLLDEKNIKASALRLDKIHPVISGNKWFKLKYYLKEAKAQKKKTILSFGGAYSNHIVALAAAGKLFGFKTIGIIRGERPPALSQGLLQAIDLGMDLIFSSREEYRKKILPAGIDNDAYLVHEGGYGPKGALGAAEILDHCKKEMYSHYCCAVGTATMMAGIIKASNTEQTVTGISIMKNNLDLDKQLLALLTADEQRKKFDLLHNYDLGGYAKYSPGLINFMNELHEATGIPTDFVYTGKLFCGIFDLVKNNFFPPGAHLLIIHSGGLQGNLSLPGGTLIF